MVSEESRPLAHLSNQGGNGDGMGDGGCRMKKISMIDWTNAVVSFCFGCAKVRPGCLRCYAADEAKRFKQLGQWGVTAPRRLGLGAMKKVRSLERSAPRARKDGAKVMATVFVNSRADFFEDRPTLSRPGNWHGRRSWMPPASIFCWPTKSQRISGVIHPTISVDPMAICIWA